MHYFKALELVLFILEDRYPSDRFLCERTLVMPEWELVVQGPAGCQRLHYKALAGAQRLRMGLEKKYADGGHNFMSRVGFVWKN